MGFLSFLNKKGKDSGKKPQSLDIPPPPPSLKGNTPIKSMPKPPEPLKKDVPPTSSVEKPLSQKDLPELPEKLFDLSKDIGLDLPEFKITEEKPKFVAKPPIHKPEVKKELPKLEKPKLPEKHEEVHEEQFEELHEPEPVIEEPVHVAQKEQPIKHGRPYISLINFKKVLGGLRIIKSDLNKSENLLQNWINSKSDKSTEFEKLRSSMNEIQKKLIFSEKTLFKE